MGACRVVARWIRFGSRPTLQHEPLIRLENRIKWCQGFELGSICLYRNLAGHHFPFMLFRGLFDHTVSWPRALDAPLGILGRRFGLTPPFSYGRSIRK